MPFCGCFAPGVKYIQFYEHSKEKTVSFDKKRYNHDDSC